MSVRNFGFILLSLFALAGEARALPYAAGSARRVNCGGGEFTDSLSNVFGADEAYSASTVQGYSSAGSSASVAGAIAGTEDDELYRSNRWGEIEYKFDLPVGVYNITFKFAETYWTASGQRKFRVYLQDVGTSSGTWALSDFDIFAEAGGKDIAVDRTISNITVNEGTLRIRFTSSYPGGVDFPCVSGIEIQKVDYAIGDVGMTDEAFINMVEYKAFQWFYENVEAPHYLASAWGPYNDGAFMTDANISGLGFQIIVYCVGVSRGWMTYDEAYNRVKAILEAVQIMKKGDSPYSDPHETYWHYVERLNPQNPIPAQDPIRSVFDNGNLMMGMVFAQEYFKGTEIDLLSRQIFEALDWNKFGDFTYPEYSEQMIAFLVGAGAPRASLRNNTMIEGFKNASTNLHHPLYYYQWFNLFFDGRNTRTPLGRNDFQYARDATLTNRQDCIDLWTADPGEYNTYDYDSWGMTAATRSDDYSAEHNNGDINPFAVAASMPFAPTEVLNAMKHMYFRFYKNGFPENPGSAWSDRYGFCQTYNIGSTPNAPYYLSSGNAGFDYGPIVMALENYRTGFVWQHAMNSEYVKAALYRIGMTGYSAPPAENLAQGKTCAASSVYGSSAAANAFDDDLMTAWESDLSASPQWISVDLGRLYAVSSAELYWSSACAKSYKFQYSSDNANWVDAVSVTTGTAGAALHSFSPKINARYARVYCTEKSVPSRGYSLWGVRIFGDNGCDASSFLNADSSPEKAFDGDTATAWSSSAGGTQWVSVDYGQETLLSKIAFNWGADYASSFKISASSDGANWSEIYSTASATGGQYAVVCQAAAFARFLRLDCLTGPGAGYTLKEILPVSNLAFGKTASASTEAAGLEALKAFDGKPSTRWSSATTDNEWLKIDLGAETKISEFVLRWEAAYASEFKLELSTDNANWSSVFQSTASAGGVEDINFPEAAARYARMTGIKRGTVWGYSLWEMEAYNYKPDTGAAAGFVDEPAQDNTTTATSTAAATTITADVLRDRETVLKLQSSYGELTLTLPAGTFGEDVAVTLSEAQVPPSSRETIKLSGVGIEITNNKNLQPGKEISITLSYREADISGLDENKLVIAYYDNETLRWRVIPSTLNKEIRQITGIIRHLSKFAIVQMAPASDLSKVFAYPVPFTPSLGRLTIENLTDTAEISIYNLAGELVKRLDYGTADGRAYWDGKNDSGNTAASGVYFINIAGQSAKKIIRFAVIR